mmetsp:Transcript_1884/g.4398  ORF Transcript_1884/g.4398 Transcript_1884/m.4398 type:complete len:212 (-) Transcript_1884:348-983(-)
MLFRKSIRVFSDETIFSSQKSIVLALKLHLKRLGSSNNRRSVEKGEVVVVPGKSGINFLGFRKNINVWLPERLFSLNISLVNQLAGDGQVLVNFPGENILSEGFSGRCLCQTEFCRNFEKIVPVINVTACQETSSRRFVCDFVLCFCGNCHGMGGFSPSRFLAQVNISFLAQPRNKPGVCRQLWVRICLFSQQTLHFHFFLKGAGHRGCVL